MVTTLLLTAVACMVPPTLVQTSPYGLNVKINVFLVGWTAAPDRVNTSGINSNPENWYWTTPDFSISVQDDGQACPFDEGWSFRVSLSNSDLSNVSVPRDRVLHWTATNSIDNRTASGAWAGQADWTLDGVINTNDFFEFLADFFAGNADFTLDGVTNSQDVFDYINWFLGPS